MHPISRHGKHWFLKRNLGAPRARRRDVRLAPRMQPLGKPARERPRGKRRNPRPWARAAIGPESRNGQSERRPIGSAPPYRYDDVELFGWSASLVIPSSHWQPGRGGHYARLRARDSDNNDLNTFLPSWLDCLGAHPELDDFINSCRSPRSPEVFIYTADFTTSVDLLIENIRRGGPGLLVRVRNQGRHGKVMGIECSHLGAAGFANFDDPIRTGETKEYGVPVATAAGQIVVCTVFGANEDGTAEVPIDNNTRTQVVF